MLRVLLRALWHMYAALWLLVLWLPLVLHMLRGSLLRAFRHFTWWCWLLQALFYTLTHPVVRRTLHLQHYWLGLGCVCGNVIFVLAGFCLVLLRHPTIVAEVDGVQLGLVQLANVGLHYLTVMVFLLWTLFDVEHLRHMLKTQVIGWQRQVLFVVAWLPVPLLYLACFGPHTIAASYGIPADGITVGGLVLVACLALQFNALYLAQLELDLLH